MAKKKNEARHKKDLPAPDSSKSWREAVESIVIAIVLAFLFRAFEAEAFVIPTGSMAPTLSGRHKDIECPECQYRYRAGASADAELNDGPVVGTTCPMCFYTEQLLPFEHDHISHTGDRILVNKFAYEAPFGEPQRWDVIVFKFPGNAKQNYIKRLVGLPGETVKIRHGDIFIKPDGADEFKIARKPPRKLKHMMQIVHDTRYLSPDLQKMSWPNNWQPANEPSGWSTDDQGHTFTGKSSSGPDWLRFQMFPADFNTWGAISEILNAGQDDLGNIKPRPALVTDYYAYNAQTRPLYDGTFYHPYPVGYHWVGDLAVEANVKVLSDTGQIMLDLIEAGRHYTSRFDLATGAATLSINNGDASFDDGQKNPRAKTVVKGRGSYDIRFANADDQLVLWVNGKVCEFDSATTFDPGGQDKPVTSADDPGDLAPVRIGVEQAEMKAERLRVWRDIYYIATRTGEQRATDYRFDFDSPNRIVRDLFDPNRWDNLFSQREEVTFGLEENQFFPLGDNSPYSRDGRLWGNEHFVERDLLIGKAIVIYWPHAWRIPIPFTGWSLPLIPNFMRMGFIR